MSKFIVLLIACLALAAFVQADAACQCVGYVEAKGSSISITSTLIAPIHAFSAAGLSTGHGNADQLGKLFFKYRVEDLI